MTNKQTVKQTAILEATLELVSEHGFHGAPTSAIAQAAGVGVGTIYRYFESKEDLIDALFNQLERQLAQAILVGYSADLPLRRRFRCLWMNTARYCIDHPLETSFMGQYANSPFLPLERGPIHAGYLQPVAEFVDHGLYEGVLKDLPLDLFVSLTLEVAISLAKKHRNGAIVLDDTVLEHAMDACWDAIRR